MTDTPAPVASAVVVPRQDAPNVKSPRRKRRQSSVSEDASKRLRISTEDKSTSCGFARNLEKWSSRKKKK
ncbi:hypothetical protein BofuT4_uP126950.1 [Botrytis cinerea T4]|uniref:Uncharacterized protein n=1 Tax=Botryotinia fuckeliana (strain T4) TaxID=999810 RepID=G2YSP9_BOTF4|nr:hypothetical protein BofuT4_uP126950.1 [Botrytis cinerea T4]